MSTFKISKKTLVELVEDAVQATFSPGTGEQYATPGALKRKVDEVATLNHMIGKSFQIKGNPGTFTVVRITPDNTFAVDSGGNKVMFLTKKVLSDNPGIDQKPKHTRDSIRRDGYGPRHTTAERKREELKYLEDELEQTVIDMEQEAEPGGGPLADEYSDKITSLQKRIRNLRAILGYTPLQENYSKFKGDVSTRSKPDQIYRAFRAADKKIQEVTKILEYCSRLQTELVEGDANFKYNSKTEETVEKIQSQIKEVLKKVASLHEQTLSEVFSPEDYIKAEQLLVQLEEKFPKLYKILLQKVIDIYPHSIADFEKTLPPGADYSTQRSPLTAGDLQHRAGIHSLQEDHLTTGDTVEIPEDNEFGYTPGTYEVVEADDERVDGKYLLKSIDGEKVLKVAPTDLLVLVSQH
jgi:hypothetical protein